MKKQNKKMQSNHVCLVLILQLGMNRLDESFFFFAGPLSRPRTPPPSPGPRGPIQDPSLENNERAHEILDI